MTFLGNKKKGLHLILVGQFFQHTAKISANIVDFYFFVEFINLSFLKTQQPNPLLWSKILYLWWLYL